MKGKNPLRIVVAIAVLLCTLLGSVFLAVAEYNTDAKQRSIDAVILLDKSRSMKTNDARGYRIDAAQMFVSMCDMNGTRVAVIPFAGSIEDADADFVDISTVSKRIEKLKNLEKLRTEFSSHTNWGQALSTAVKMIINRSDQTNAPMILLLSDGANELDTTEKDNDAEKKKGERDVPVWNADLNTFETKHYPFGQFDEKESTRIGKLAASAAESFGIPIYTIALHEAPVESEDVKECLDDLNYISNATHKTCTPINSNNANTLPRIFGEMLASQIGSNLLKEKETKPTPVADREGMYEVELPILNNSVLEANIFIPLVKKGDSGITSGNIWLYNAEGVDVSAGDGKSIIVLDSEDHFRLYKIREPASKGTWKLQYMVSGSNTNAEDISFSILYNYNVQLKTFIGPNAASLHDDAVTMLKSGKLTIQSMFYDNTTNVPSTDKNLYQQQTGSAWHTIQGRYELCDLGGNVCFSGELFSDQSSMFAGVVDLSHAMMDKNGYSLLTDGDYLLRVILEGAGLKRQTEQPVTLQNTPPACTSSTIVLNANVDDPQEPDTQTPRLLSIKLSGFFPNADNDRLDYTLAPNDGAATNASVLNGEMPPSTRAQDIVDLSIVEKDDGIYAEGSTIKDDASQLQHYGTASYTLTVTDNDANGVAEIPLQVVVNNVTITERAKYRCNTSVTGMVQGTVDKNSPITFTMNLTLADDGTADTTGAIRFYSGIVNIYDADNNSILINDGVSRDMVFNDKKTQLSYTFTTGNTQKKYKAVCQYYYDSRPMESKTIMFQVDNHAPTLVPGALSGLPDQLTFHPLPAALRFLEQETPLDVRTIDLTTLFTDSDNETLTILSPECVRLDGGSDQSVTMQQTDQTVVLVPISEGRIRFTCTAVDGDGQTVVDGNGQPVFATWDFSVVDITSRWIRYGILAAVAIIIIVLICAAVHQACKPKYAASAAIQEMSNSSLFPSATQNLPSGSKKLISLSSFIDPSLAENNGIQLAKLDNLKIRPLRRSRDCSVEVRWAKPDATYGVSIGDDAIGTKWTLWAQDSELEIKNGSSSLRLRLIDESGTTELPPQENWAFNDDFGGGTGGFGGSVVSDSGSPSDFGSFGATLDAGSSAGNTGSYEATLGTSPNDFGGFGDSFSATKPLDGSDTFGG